MTLPVNDLATRRLFERGSDLFSFCRGNPFGLRVEHKARKARFDDLVGRRKAACFDLLIDELLELGRQFQLHKNFPEHPR